MYKTIHSRRYKALLKTLVEVRRGQGVTQVDLAKRLRERQSWISKCERGVRRLDVVELEIWCEALGLPLNEFLKLYAVASVPERR